MIDAVADTCLGSEIYYDVKVVLLEERVDERFVADGALNEHMLHRRCGCNGVDLLQPPLLKAHLVVVVHVVEGDNSTRGEGLEKADHKIRTDETGGAGYEDGFVVEINGCFHIKTS